MSEDRNICLDINEGNYEGTEDFWENTSALFTAESLYVIIKTPRSTFKVIIDEEDNENFQS